VAIRQVKPGLRFRAPFNVKLGLRKHRDFFAAEEGAAWAFEMVAGDPEAKAIRDETDRLVAEGRGS
jgi:hypothetical protein